MTLVAESQGTDKVPGQREFTHGGFFQAVPEGQPDQRLYQRLDYSMFGWGRDLKAAKLGPGAYAIGMALRERQPKHLPRGEIGSVKLETLADDTGMSVRTAKTHMAALVAAGLVSTNRRHSKSTGSRLASTYRLTRTGAGERGLGANSALSLGANSAPLKPRCKICTADEEVRTAAADEQSGPPAPAIAGGPDCGSTGLESASRPPAHAKADEREARQHDGEAVCALPHLQDELAGRGGFCPCGCGRTFGTPCRHLSSTDGLCDDCGMVTLDSHDARRALRRRAAA